MKISLSQLMQSDGIYLMPFWWLSKGARFEAFMAWRLDIPRIKEIKYTSFKKFAKIIIKAISKKYNIPKSVLK